jgi:AraC-like DNA-binding protein
MNELPPSDVVLLALAAGTLDEVQHVAIDDHVRGCGRCRSFVRAMEHVGGLLLDHLPPTPSANKLLLPAQVDQEDAFLIPHRMRLRRELTLRQKPIFRDYARNVRDVEVKFPLTEGIERDWSIRRCALTDISIQFARTGASTIAEGMADQSDAIVFALQSSMLSDHIIMNGQKASASDIAVLPPGCDFIFTGRAAYEWISIMIPINKLPSILTDCVRESIEKREAARITTNESRYQHLLRVAAKTAKLPRRADISSGHQPEISEDELIDALSGAITAAKDDQDRLRRRDPRDSYQIVRSVLTATRESNPIHVADLCQISSIRQRTLAQAFTDVFDMSPARYLKLRLLNNIHKTLLTPEARRRHVADILLSGGVIELDEFTTEYCLLFGETPSETLRHSQPCN